MTLTDDQSDDHQPSYKINTTDINKNLTAEDHHVFTDNKHSQTFTNIQPCGNIWRFQREEEESHSM